MNKLPMLTIAAVRLAAGAPVMAEVTLKAGPTAKADGEGVLIQFTLSEAADVEVAILNAKGKLALVKQRIKVAAEAPKPEPKPEPKVEPKPEPKVEPKPEPKVEP
ncbi:hypothetical protein LCGC14_1939940, partial [marine sediment metagenome]